MMSWLYVGECRSTWLMKKQRHGFGLCIWEQGTIQEGKWKNDQFKGQGRTLFFNGETLTGKFKEGMCDQSGVGTIQIKEFMKWQGEIQYGKPHGKGCITSKDFKQFFIDLFKLPIASIFLFSKVTEKCKYPFLSPPCCEYVSNEFGMNNKSLIFESIYRKSLKIYSEIGQFEYPYELANKFYEFSDLDSEGNEFLHIGENLNEGYGIRICDDGRIQEGCWTEGKLNGKARTIENF